MKTIEIKILSPVHIGSGRELSRDTEFLIKGNTVGVIEEEKVLSLIGKENIHQWVSIIDNKKSLLDYLEQRSPGKALNLAEVCKYSLPLHKVSRGNINTLKEHMHDGLGRPFIPGSSIKGSIRTAILNILIEKLGKEWREHDLKNRRGKITDTTVQKEIFGADPNHDFMRFVKVGDAHFEPDDLAALPVLSLNYLSQRERTKRDASFFQLAEALKAGAATHFRMKIDHGLWKKNIQMNEMVNTIPDFLDSENRLFAALNQFTIRLLKDEIDFWEEDRDLEPIEDYLIECQQLLRKCQDCSEGEAVIRIGHGSGWIFMTGAWVKNEKYISDNLYNKIVDNTRPWNYRYREYFFPKTRRMLQDGTLMGFVKLKLC